MIRNFTILLFFLISTGLLSRAQDKPDRKTLKQWTLSSDFTEEVPVQFDTLFSLFHRYRIADTYSPLNATLGSYGLPFYQMNFFDRRSDPDEFLYSNYYPFMWLPGKAMFMNTQVPFTELVWSNGGPRETSEQTFRVRHSQNVNRFLNFGLVYDIIFNLGQYNYQRAENKTFTFYSSYTGTKYKVYFSSGINNITSFENGGVRISSPDQLGLFDTREVPLNMGPINIASSILKNRNILLVQRYTLGKQLVENDTLNRERKGFLGLSGTFSHIFIIDNNKRTYSDNSARSGFYDTAYINSSITFDSLTARSIKNTIRFDFTTDESRKFRLGGGVGLRNELFRYSQIIPVQAVSAADTTTWKRDNNAVLGKLFNNIGEKFRWTADGELYLTGYRAGDFNLKGEISKVFALKKGDASWLINGVMLNQQPAFWYQQWGSNHFKWYNDMKKVFRIDLGTSFSYPYRKAEIKFNYAVIDNYTDFNLLAMPSQHQGGLSVASLLFRKEFRAWKFHLSGDLLVQQSSNEEILDLPLATVRSAGYFEHLFKFKKTNGRLNTQLGADVTYHTRYYPYSYMPATGRFYRQEDVVTGDYPFINVFINLKLKRTRIFVMSDHINSGLMGYNYYMIPSYPMNVRMLRYGVAWTFYN